MRAIRVMHNIIAQLYLDTHTHTHTHTHTYIYIYGKQPTSIYNPIKSSNNHVDRVGPNTLRPNPSHVSAQVLDPDFEVGCHEQQIRRCRGQNNTSSVSHRVLIIRSSARAIIYLLDLVRRIPESHRSRLHEFGCEVLVGSTHLHV
jgi:hypothetical protein